eukprot:Rmarinus@m.28521
MGKGLHEGKDGRISLANCFAESPSRRSSGLQVNRYLVAEFLRHIYWVQPRDSFRLNSLFPTSQVGPGTDDSIGRQVVLEYFSIRFPGILWRSNQRYAGGNHPLVLSKNCKPDIMAAVKRDGMEYPFLIVELISGYESKNPLAQLEVKLVDQLTLASCAFVEGADEGIELPTCVWGVALPGWNQKGLCYTVKVEWNMQSFQFQSSVTQKCLQNIDDLSANIDEVMQWNEHLRRWLTLARPRPQFSPDDDYPVIFQFNGALLDQIDKGLG